MRHQNATIETIADTVREYSTEAGIQKIRKAYDFALEKTKEAKEETGRPLIVHLLNTAQIMAELHLDTETVIATLLHYPPHDSQHTFTWIEKEFGTETAKIVEGLNKIVEIEEKNVDKLDSSSLSLIVLATSKDIRSLILRLATGTERLRSIQSYPKEKQEIIANNTLKMYAPLCHKLGLTKLEWEMEDLALKTLNPQAYNKIKEKVCAERSVREKELEKIKEEIRDLLQKKGYSATIQARLKNFYSVYKKLQSGKKFSEIRDLRGIRIICNTVEECYELLGLLHSNYLPSTTNFQDYIALPKKNGYKSIHTCIYWRRKIVEIQIRTWQMHFEAETGVSAHWRYKKYEEDSFFDKKISWAKQLVDWQQQHPNAKDFLKSLKIEFGEKETFVFTPKKKIVILPEKSTPIDFAFAVHSDLGMKCKQAKVNGKISSLDKTLENGDIVEIIAGKKPEVKRSWLTMAKTRKAIAKIKKALGIELRTTETEQKKETQHVRETEKIKIARCCNPLPGDNIIGYKTSKRKTSIHKADCQNLSLLPKNKITAITWSKKIQDYRTSIKVNARDRPGLLNDILSKLAENQAIINTTQTKINKNNTANCEFEVKIKNPKQLEKIIKEIETIPYIYSVTRK